MGSANKRIATFLLLTIVLSSPTYYQAITKGDLSYADMLQWMWSPGLAAVITCLIFKQPLRSLGLRPGKVRFLALSYLTPFLYALAASVVVWGTGYGKFLDESFLAQKSAYYGWEGLSTPAFLLLFVGYQGSAGVVKALLGAAGEEIGWRGFLVPALLENGSFMKTSLAVGAIWSLWHYPLIIFAQGFEGLHILFALACFTLLVLSISVAFTWLRIASGSFWTGALMHASHNLFIQEVFTPMTGETGITEYFTSEYGVALAVVTPIFAYYFFRKRSRLAAPAA